MEWMEMFQDIFELVIIPLLVVLSGYVIKFINLKSVELTNKVDNEKHDKYVLMLQDTVTDCVLTTTQTYVDALKGQNAFDLEAQKTAFEMTKTAVLAILTEDAKEYLNSALGDFDEYLKTLIEAQVQVNKLATAN
jgi:hypothetical protein